MSWALAHRSSPSGTLTEGVAPMRSCPAGGWEPGLALNASALTCHWPRQGHRGPISGVGEGTPTMARHCPVPAAGRDALFLQERGVENKDRIYHRPA